jgi:hypothetical protein
MGIVVDIFDDLDANHPWIRVHFTTGRAAGSKQWCKTSALQIIKKGDAEAPLPGAGISGSL